MSGQGIALVGCGLMGEFHARAYDLAERLVSSPDRRPVFVVVADVEEGRAQALATQWEAGRWTSDWREAVEDPTVAIVDVCTVPSLHHEIASAAIDAGKHVYCEKPVGLNSGESEALARAADAAGLTTFVSFNYRWIPAMVWAKELLASGRIGEPRLVDISFASDWAVDPRIWNWRFSSREAGLGALGDVGSHVFDMARYLVGEIVEVCGTTDTFIATRGEEPQTHVVDTDDVWAVLGRFENGALGTFRGSRISPGTTVSFTVDIAGSRGGLRWSIDQMNEVQLYEPSAGGVDGFTTIRLGPQHGLFGMFSPIRGLGVGFGDSKVAEICHLLECVASGREARPSFWDACAVARVLEAANDQGWIAIDLPSPVGTVNG